MKYSCLLLLLSMILYSCNPKAAKEGNNSAPINDTTIIDKLAPLKGGQYDLSEKDFGAIVNLAGSSLPVEQIFRVSECEMIANDTLIIVKNLHNPELFMAYSLPEFKFVKTFGIAGSGPGEYQYPSLVKDESEEYICFVYEKTSNTLRGLNKKLELIDLSVDLSKGNRKIYDKQLSGISSNEFLFAESVPKGKAVFHFDIRKDSAKTKKLAELSFSEKHKNWAAYIGDFGASDKHKRIVYAYKYFKRLMFYDMETGTIKVLSFDSQEKTEEGEPRSMLAPSNKTHYWGMSANDNSVYVLYSGRTPIDVGKELRESTGYIFVEQFDWNGNPIKKYKLDHWGYFCVDKQEKYIYQVSTTKEQPFVRYEIGER